MTTNIVKIEFQSDLYRANYSTSFHQIESYDDFDYALIEKNKVGFNTISNRKNMINLSLTYNIFDDWVKRSEFNKQEINTLDIKKLNNIQKLDNLKKKYMFYYSNVLINRTKSILEMSNIQPSITPTNRKSILLRYDNKNGKFLTFELYSFKYTFVVVPEKDMQRDLSKYYTEENLKYNSKKVEEILKGFYGEVRELNR